MALIKCTECGKEISDKAVSCPHCGSPLRNADESQTKKKSLFLRPLFWIVVIVIGLIVWAVNDYNENKMTPEKAREQLDKAFDDHMKQYEKEDKNARRNLDIIRNGR